MCWFYSVFEPFHFSVISPILHQKNNETTCVSFFTQKLSKQIKPFVAGQSVNLSGFYRRLFCIGYAGRPEPLRPDQPDLQAPFPAALLQIQRSSPVRPVPPVKALHFCRHTAPRPHLRPRQADAHQEADEQLAVDLQDGRSSWRRQPSCRHL